METGDGRLFFGLKRIYLRSDGILPKLDMAPKIKVFAYVFSIFLVGTYCTKNTIHPKLDPELINEPDRFEFKITDVRSITQQLEYQWRNNGLNANIYNESVITDGEASVILNDAAGDEVFSSDLVHIGNFFSNSGEAGEWRVRVNMKNVSGTIYIRIIRRP